MADDVDRSEQPTPKRRQEAKKKGQIAVSQEVFVVANLLGVTLMLMTMGVGVIYQGMATFRTLWQPRHELDVAGAMEVLRVGFGAAGRIMFPILMAAMVSGIIAGLIQTRGNISREKLKPKASKINPGKNLSKIIKKSAPVDLGKSLLKLAIVGSVLWFVVVRHISDYPTLSRLPLLQIIGFQMDVVLEAYLSGAMALILIAAADYAYQYWQTEKSLKMTKSEVKDERRQAEGDPMVKSRARTIQMDRARQRMMEAVPNADVIVTNPEHVAVALLYKRSEMPAPKVVAKGAGFLAQRIREVATEAGVPIVENPPLARSLYRYVKVGKMVPEKFFQAVAELLAYVYRLDRSRAEAW